MKRIRRSLAVFLAAALLLSAAATAFAANYTVYYYAGEADKDERVPDVCKNVDEGDSYTILRPGAVFDGYDDYIEDGYEFYCWEDQNGKEYAPKDTVRFRSFDGGALKLTAVWDEDRDDAGHGVSYGVTYSAGDAGKSSVKRTYSGDFEAEAPESVFDDFAKYKGDGYRFVFWMDKIGNTFLAGDPVDVGGEPFNASYNMTLTAAWLDDGDYPVYFRSGTTEAKGADPASFYAEYGKSYTLPENPYTLAGYAFAGWDVAGTLLRPGDKYSVRDGLVVKAVWKDAGAELTYRPGEGQGAPYTETYEAGQTITLAENTFTRAGYAFAGWMIGSIRTVIPEGTSVVIAGNDTATAQWTPAVPAPETSAAPEASSAPEETTSSEAAGEPESAVEEAAPEEAEPDAEADDSKTLSYTISGDTPVSGIIVRLENGVEHAELLVNPITDAAGTDPTTAFLLENGDAAAAFDLALRSGGSAYGGKTAGTILFHTGGGSGIPDSPYRSSRIAMAHVTPLDAFEGDGYYKLADGKTVWYSLADGGTEESESVSLVESRGIRRAVIADPSAAPARFAYLSDDATVVEVALGQSADAASFEIGFTSLSPFLLLWVELRQGPASPLLWIAAGVGILLAALCLVFFLRHLKRQRAVLAGVTGNSEDAAAGDAELPGREDRIPEPENPNLCGEPEFGGRPDPDMPGPPPENPDWGEFKQK